MLIYRLMFDCYVFRYGQTFAVRTEQPQTGGYDYLLRIPRGYTSFSQPYPLLIFLHGAGESGTDVLTLSDKDVFAVWHERHRDRNFPFIVVSPICPGNRWEPRLIIDILDRVMLENKYRFAIDPSRIYLTGYSMGGFGTFETAMEYPDRFTAIAPLSGGGECAKAEKLRDMPIWAFHGAEDMIVPVSSSQLLIEEIKRCGNQNTHLTIFHKKGHDIVQQVYIAETMYSWMLKFPQGQSLNRSTGGDTGNFVNGSLP
jgi:predicted peptidase